MRIHRKLGPGLLESVYLRILAHESGNKSAAISQARSIKSDPTLKEQHADANEFLTGDPD